MSRTRALSIKSLWLLWGGLEPIPAIPGLRHPFGWEPGTPRAAPGTGWKSPCVCQHSMSPETLRTGHPHLEADTKHHTGEGRAGQQQQVKAVPSPLTSPNGNWGCAPTINKLHSSLEPILRDSFLSGLAGFEMSRVPVNFLFTPSSPCPCSQGCWQGVTQQDSSFGLAGQGGIAGQGLWGRSSCSSSPWLLSLLSHLCHPGCGQVTFLQNPLTAAWRHRLEHLWRPGPALAAIRAPRRTFLAEMTSVNTSCRCSGRKAVSLCCWTRVHTSSWAQRLQSSKGEGKKQETSKIFSQELSLYSVEFFCILEHLDAN